MRTREHKGFGPPPTAQKVEQAINKLFAQRELEIKKLREDLKNPVCRGQVDALFGRPCASKEPYYHAGYMEGMLAMVQAPVETIQMIEQMKLMVEKLLEEIDEASAEGGGCHATAR